MTTDRGEPERSGPPGSDGIADRSDLAPPPPLTFGTPVSPPPPPPPPLTRREIQAAALRAEGAFLTGDADAAGRDVRYERLKAEVDALQVQVMRRDQPWYRDATSLVAILALLFSFGTTVVSFQRTAQEDVHASEIELRALITRLAAIPVEMTEATKTYSDDPATVASLTSIITQEQLLIAKQAAQVLGGLPTDRVTAAQYLLVANVLIGNGIDEGERGGLRLLDRALEVAGDVNDFVSASRVKAFRIFQLGQVEEGRALYQQALEVFGRKGFDSTDENFKTYTHLQTQVGWAQAELSVGNCTEARQHIDEARVLSARFSVNDNQVRRMEAVASAIVDCRPGATAPPGSPSPIVP